MRSILLLALPVLLIPAPMTAQSPTCSDGTFYDDGNFEGQVSFNNIHGAVAMTFDAPFLPAQVSAVCLCWKRQGSADSITFNLNVWQDINGTVGPLLGRITGLQASGLTFGNPLPFRYDLSSSGIVVNGPVFIGPDWDSQTAPGIVLCEDQGNAPARPGFLCLNASDTAPCAPDQPLSQADPSYKALGVRAKFDPPTSGCIPSDTALCLSHGRFKVEAKFTVIGQPERTAHVVKLTDETGYFWFFSPVNVEAVLKVIDACSFNQRFWVFAGGLTNVEVVITVTDTQAGMVKTFTNPQGKPFQPIQNTSAFPTC